MAAGQARSVSAQRALPFGRFDFSDFSHGWVPWCQLHRVLPLARRQQLIDWVYGLQLPAVHTSTCTSTSVSAGPFDTCVLAVYS